MEAGSGSGARDARVITDTCSALKLLSVGKIIFEPGRLSLGDLVLHPRLFNETRRWDSARKERYKSELALAAQLRAAPGIAVHEPDRSRIDVAIKATRDECSLSVGQADIDQLTSVIHFDFKLVTNDRQLAELSQAFDVEVHSAEAVLLEAIEEGVLTKAEGIEALRRWRDNGERPMPREVEAGFRKLGIAIQRGFLSDGQ